MEKRKKHVEMFNIMHKKVFLWLWRELYVYVCVFVYTPAKAKKMWRTIVNNTFILYYHYSFIYLF